MKLSITQYNLENHAHHSMDYNLNFKTYQFLNRVSSDRWLSKCSPLSANHLLYIVLYTELKHKNKFRKYYKQYKHFKNINNYDEIKRKLYCTYSSEFSQYMWKSTRVKSQLSVCCHPLIRKKIKIKRIPVG